MSELIATSADPWKGWDTIEVGGAATIAGPQRRTADVRWAEAARGERDGREDADVRAPPDLPPRAPREPEQEPQMCAPVG